MALLELHVNMYIDGRACKLTETKTNRYVGVYVNCVLKINIRYIGVYANVATKKIFVISVCMQTE